MKKNRKIDMTVIVPVYNTEEYLPVCIDSLIRQDELCLEIILINDGSTDRSGSIADQYAGQDSRIKVIHQENRGASAARNAGLESAQGDYIAFVDSDDRVIKNTLGELYRQANNNQADIVMGNLLYIHEDNIINGPYKPVSKEFKNRVFSGKKGFIRLVQDGSYRPMQCNYIYRRGYLEKINVRFEEGIIHEDELWTPIVLCESETMIVIDLDFYYYCQRERSVMQSTTINRHLKSLFLVTERLFDFADRFDFSGEHAALRNWLNVHICQLNYRTIRMLSPLHNFSVTVPDNYLDRFRHNSREMMPEAQKICNFYLRHIESYFNKYSAWRPFERRKEIIL